MHSSPPRYDFASDNTAGISPESLAAIQEANAGSIPSYGEDEYTAGAANAFRELFGTDCEVFFVFNGTAANSLALASLCQSYHSVITADSAHVETDECGAPEFFSNGTKLLLANAVEGRIGPEEVVRLVKRRTDIHYPKPRAVSISQSSELGTVYRPEEIRNLAATAHGLDLFLHMDGARFANAVASLGCHPAEITWKAGIDVLCFGGTKNGIGLSEAVVFFRKSLAEDFEYRCKQAGQLASKMRFLSAPWQTAFQSGSWLANAGSANALARQLADTAAGLPGVKLLHPCEANAVFLELPESAHKALFRAGWRYYRFIGGGARFMCSWQTRPETVEALLEDLRKALEARVC